MEQYKSNVTVVMEFLKSRGFSPSVISQHKRCYQELEVFLATTEQSYSFEAARQWIESNQTSWNYRKYTGYGHCIRQLEDVYLTGIISSEHLHFQKPPYNLLIPEFKELLDSFICNCNNERNGGYRLPCARFLLYMQNNGVSTIECLNYSMLLKFHKEDYHRSQSSKAVYESMIRVFLRYLASNGKCPFGISLALNKLLIPQIIKIPDKELQSCSSSDSQRITWDNVLHFLSQMKDIGYSSSVLKSSKHILSLLYIFLDMHNTGINKEVVWHWFHKVKPLLGTNVKQHRRTICQFLNFMDNGTIITATTGNPDRTDSMEALPTWAKEPLTAYLALLKREGMQPSTIAMQKSSNLRFCRYLADIGIHSFNEVTPDIVKDFNLQDKHATPESKAAYNCRIRSFIIYLYEQNFQDAPYLHRALPTIVAPKTSVVKILSEKDVAAIWAVKPENLSPKELRDYAIVCIGLSMGFRASDIISLRFTDVNWVHRSISIIQKKTGKSLTMPMPVKTGNILFRYIRDGRPKSNSPYIFIRHEAPYDGLKGGVCRDALRRFVSFKDEQRCSFHIVRKTFATNLLAGNANIELISGALGHSTDGTVHKYLSLDEERMRLCPLSLADTGISYKGGAFHA